MSAEISPDEVLCSSILRAANSIVVVSGAGISAESGIPTFRDVNGLWSRFPPEEFANWAGILRLIFVDPARIAEFLISLLGPIVQAQPNPAHRAIAFLQKRKPTTLVTQNIDRLHQRAGSQAVVELHGSIFEVRYIGSAKSREISVETLAAVLNDLEDICRHRPRPRELLKAISPIAGFDSGGIYRPNIVLFGDGLPKAAWDRAVSAAARCDCMLIVGCTQRVEPAASVPCLARTSGARIIGIGPESTGADVWLTGTAGDLLPRLIQNVLSS
jgi:NAD-dependent deacetylase